MNLSLSQSIGSSAILGWLSQHVFLTITSRKDEKQEKFQNNSAPRSDDRRGSGSRLSHSPGAEPSGRTISILPRSLARPCFTPHSTLNRSPGSFRIRSIQSRMVANTGTCQARHHRLGQTGGMRRRGRLGGSSPGHATAIGAEDFYW